MDGTRGGGSKRGRGTVCVVAWLRRRKREGGREEDGEEKKRLCRDGEDVTGAQRKKKSKDRWGFVDSARRKAG